MASNGYGNSGSTILVMYRIVNHESDKDDPLFNAFHMPRNSGTTLKAVKENCEALRYLNHLGADGYHWRVCVEDKPVPGGSSEKTYSWWDIQDENARLPVKEAPQSQIAKLFAPRREFTSTDVATKAAKGAFKSLGKAMNVVAGTEGPVDQGPPVSVIAFKLLDLMKMHDDFSTKHGGKHGFSAPAAPRARAPAPAPARQPQQQQTRAPAAPRQQQQQQQPPPQRAQPQRAPQPARQPQQHAAAASLLDFGADAAAPVSHSHGRTLHHATSSPAAFDQLHSRPPPPPVNESRAEKLKREYTAKQQTANRVWDDVDQRWVEVDPAAGATAATASAPPGAEVQKKKEIGISLDPANAVGKSHHVQAAVHKRVNDMRQSQQKAIQEIKEREEQKKREEAAEDEVRARLEPKIKAWSEEHGKKKQLRALLGTLHIILWPEADWKPIGLGDLLDDSKCKRAFHKASRVVHPDKTHHLDAEKRFLAKRIFDALSQAKNQFDEGAK